MLLRSLKDRGHVELIHNWNYLYYYVNVNGVKFLREALGIFEENVFPLTFKASKKPIVGRDDEEEEGRDRRQRGKFGGRDGRREGGRDGGRRREGREGRRTEGEDVKQEGETKQTEGETKE